MSAEIIKRIIIHCNGEGCKNTFEDTVPVKDVREQLSRANTRGWHRSKGGLDDLCLTFFAKKHENRTKPRWSNIVYGRALNRNKS